MQAAAVLGNMRGDKAYDAIVTGASKVYGGAAAGQGGNTVTGLTQNLQESVGLALKPTGDALLPVLAGTEKGLISVLGAARRLNEETGGAAGLTFVMIAGVVVFRRFSGSAITAFSAARGLTTAITEFGLAADKAAVSARNAAVASGEKAGADVAGAAAEGATARAGGGLLARLGLRSGGAAAAEAGAVSAGGRIAAVGLRVAGGAALVGIPLAIDLGAHALAARMAESKDRDARIRGGGLAGLGTGASIGATIGAIGGSIIPGVGTVIGAVAGGAVGSIIGVVVGKHQAREAEADKAKEAATDRNTQALQGNTQAIQQMAFRILGGGSRANGTASLLEMEYAFAHQL